MRPWEGLLLVIGIMTSICACGGIRLRDDVFLTRPVWESVDGPFAELRSLHPPEGIGLTKQEREWQELAKAPALAGLVSQVLKEPVRVPAPLSFTTTRGRTIIVEVLNPLPLELAELPITRAIVSSMKESYLAGKYFVRSAELPNLRLGHGDFRDFIKVLNESALSPYTTAGSPNIQTAGNEDLTFMWLWQKYLIAYVNGKFVDRTGGITSKPKPKLRVTITNEQITAFESVLLEAFWDWVIFVGGLDVPIVYEGLDDKNQPKFLTADGNTPTLWMALKDAGFGLPVKSVVEPVATTENTGISRSKLCVIRAVSGVAGDAAQGTTGIIVRALGGVNLGFVLMGKFSFGDNDTLTKIVDTFTENTGRRATEIFASQVLYNDRSTPARSGAVL